MEILTGLKRVSRFEVLKGAQKVDKINQEK